MATAHLLDGGIDAKPAQSLDKLCTLALQLGIYRDCVHFYPFILGAEPVRPVDLAAFYAAIAEEGARPTPHTVEAIEQDGSVYRRQSPQPAPVSAADRAAFYQLKSMLQGVVKRGTAHALAPISPYVAGKTGTTEDQNDTWFVGFTNDITIAVWVGYDNAGDSHRTLGDGATGAAVAAPIFQSIVEAAWNEGFPKTVLAPPSAQAMSQLSCKGADPDSDSGRSRHGSRGSYGDCLRLDPKGRPIEARNRLVSRESSYARRNTDDEGSRRSYDQPPPGSSAYGSYRNYGNWGWSGGWAAPQRGFWSW
jgi:membrane peptidoglycan carboxypeptidase